MFKRLVYFFILVFFIVSCTKENEAPRLTAYNVRVVEYFKEIALGFEIGNASKITRRWQTNLKIYVGGKPTPEHLSELNKIINEVNSLATTGFRIETVSDSAASNYYVHFGSAATYTRIFPNQAGQVTANFGLFSIFWNGAQVLNRGYMFVDIHRTTPTEQKHLLREELTQSLGLGQDSELYPESIFQQAYSTKTTKYAPIDRDLIRLLYHPKMKVGLNANQVDAVLGDILLAEQ